MLKKLLYSTALVVLATLLIAIPVFAIDDPDVPPDILGVYVYEDLQEDGDLGILVDYFIDYTLAGIPDETVTESYLVAFIDTDGTTQLGTVAPYAFDTSGYGRGLVWIYFTAAEVFADSIDVANEALHTVWLMGNPTVESGWDGDPPKTTAAIDDWRTEGEGDPAILVAQRVLYYADVLGLAWTEVLVETTTGGSRLTTLGEAYFSNVINNLRMIAPVCFATGAYEQTMENLDYATAFGATMTNGTGTCVGSPITLTAGDNTVDVTVAGTFILELVKGTSGTASSIPAEGTVTGSPATLVEGTNTITVPGGGTGDILINVNLDDTQAAITATITGTTLDLGTLYPGEVETLPEQFSLSTITFSSLIWMGITLVICAGAYKAKGKVGFGGGGGSKMVMVIFDICIIGGAVLGLLDIIVAVLLFIVAGIMTGYVLFYRHASF